MKDFLLSWDIEMCVLGSLFIQVFLTFVAPKRKSSASIFWRLLIWVLYLSADAIALFAIGLIAKNKTDSPHKKEILAFWAPFLLLHLGGPDTITALALEDNELWNRHALQLATQLIVTIYVFTISFRHNGLLMLIPTLLILVDGLWKYLERTYALFNASDGTFQDSLMGKPDPGPNYVRLMEEYVSANDAHIRADFKGRDDLGLKNFIADDQLMNNGLSTNKQKAYVYYVRKAHLFYEMFRPTLADGFLSIKDRERGRHFFVHSNNGFKLIEIELDLIYDVFYTKLPLLQWNVFARPICFICAIVSLLVFYFKDRSKYNKVDVIITFVLLGGAIALDICAALIFAMSDWSIIIMNSTGGKVKNCFKSIMSGINSCSLWLRRYRRQRWSESIFKYNMLRHCFREPPFFYCCFSNIKLIRDALIDWLYIKEQDAHEDLIQLVTDELKLKAKQATDTKLAKEVCSARGNLILQNNYFLVSEFLSPWTVDVDYDESVLIWHLATDICYWNSVEISEKEIDGIVEREVSKELSDYMAYLLLRKQTFLSSVVGMSNTRFVDTCADAKKFMNHASIKLNWLKDPWWKFKKFLSCNGQNTSGENQIPSKRLEIPLFKEFSRRMSQQNANVKPIVAKGDKSKSVLFDACQLAKQLEIFGERQWEITSKVWVELLCYAAVRCTPRSHIAQLRTGGELITIVWLYMTHLGLGLRFQQNQGLGWTKLRIPK